MDDFTEGWIKKRVEITSRVIERIGLMNIDELVEAFKFDNRKIDDVILKNPFLQEKYKDYGKSECPLYGGDNFCHEGQERYCLLCACMNYDSLKSEGGCKLNLAGEFYDRSGHDVSDKIWDCNSCNYPHSREATEKALKIVKKKYLEKKGDNLNEILFELFTGQLVDEKV